MTMTAMTSADSTYPLIGQVATTATAMRAAADLIESTGIAGLSATCDDDRISVQVTQHLGDAGTRASLVARLATAIGTTAVRTDATTPDTSLVQAYGAIGGLAVHIYTVIAVRHHDGLPLATGPTGAIAQPGPGEQHLLPPGWRWLTHLDPTPGPADSGQVA